MAISPKSIKILWSSAGGRCAFPDCWQRLSFHEAEDVAPYTLGEMAHICGEKPGANRHDSSQNETARDSYENLILLCPTHHSLIDRKENERVYTVALLHEMKSNHEARVLDRLDSISVPTRESVARTIFPLLEENRQSWGQYGPMSELARSQPHNDAAHAVWLSERLSVIVPNNRQIARILESHRAIFDLKDQPAIAAFLMHTRSYERWVDDLIPYAAVRRFPMEFDQLVRGISNGGT